MDYQPVYTDEIIVESHNNEWKNPAPSRIETDRLEIKPLLNSTEPSEIYKLYQKYPNTDKWSEIKMEHPKTYGEMLNRFEEIEKLQDENKYAYYAIYEKGSGELLGRTTIEHIDYDTKKCSIGIWIRKDRWNEGFSKERAEGLIYAIFTEMEIDTVDVLVVTKNKRSISAVDSYMEDFGGSYDGILRNGCPTVGFGILDQLVWSITEEEFFNESKDYNRESPSLDY